MVIARLSNQVFSHVKADVWPVPLLKAHFRSVSRCHYSASPIIVKKCHNDIETEIDEEELFKYSRHRWLTFDESELLTNRYRKFNVTALLEASVAAVGGTATRCVKILKCLEGVHNKSFLLTMDNGVEVIAKLPNPNAGPAFFTTASQAATQKFVREILDLPCPRVYAYSPDPSNAVGAEYIIEEKAAGAPLGSMWETCPEMSRIKLVSQLAEFEARLATPSFRCHGSLYLKKDLAQCGNVIRDFEAPLLHPTSARCDYTALKEFVIGPSTVAALWAGERATMAGLNRGPWNDPLDYMISIGTNEQVWAKSHAKPRAHPYRLGETQFPSMYESLLNQYLSVIPDLSPDPIPASLSHPDLHLDNIFVDPETKNIKCFIDWQSALVSEPYFQSSSPLMLTLKDDAHDGESDPEMTKLLRTFTDIGDHYQTLKKKHNPQQWAATHHANRHLLTTIVSSVTGSWTRDNGICLRNHLMALEADWESGPSLDFPCPIQFTQEEKEYHRRDLEVVARLAPILEQLEESRIIPDGGKVESDDYERALGASRSVKDWFVSEGKSNEEKELNAQVWPYRT